MIRTLMQFLRLEHIRNFMTLFSSSAFAQGISLLLAPVLSRIFTPDDFGLVALYLGILSVLSVLSTAKYEQAIMLPRKNSDAVHIFRLVVVISLAFSLLSLFVFLFFNARIAAMLGNPGIAGWLYLMPVSLFLHAIIQASTFYSNRTKEFGRIAKTTIIQNISLNVIRLGDGFFKTTPNGLISGQLTAQIVAAAYIARKTLKQIKNASVGFSVFKIRDQARKYIQYPRFNLLLSLTNNLSGTLPVFLFTWGFSAEVAGLYAFGYTFVFRPLGLFSQSTQQVLSQKTIESHHEGRDVFPGLIKLTTRFFIAGIIPFLILAIWAPDIFSFLFSDSYRDAGSYIQILSPWLFMVYLSSPLSFLPELFFRQKKAMIIDMVYLILRFASLMAGIYTNDLWLALVLFSGVSTIVVGYNLFWYLYLAKKGRLKPGGNESQ